MKKYLLITLLACSQVIYAGKKKEHDYQVPWCDMQQGKTEVVLSDRTRVDCLTEHYAIEFDFGRKWSEAIGQSLGYAIETMKTPGIVLILERKKDYKYWIKLNTVIDYYQLPIKTWVIKNY